MSLSYYLAFALILASTLAVSAEDYPCNTTFSDKTGTQGTLVIQPSSECLFSFVYEMSKPKTVNVKIDNLVGMMNDASVAVHRMEPDPDVHYNFNSPFNPGYIRLTLVSATRISFTVKKEVRLDIEIGSERLDVPCSSTREYDLLLTNLTEKVDFSCTETEPVVSHVELARATFGNSNLHHQLVSTHFTVQPFNTRVIIKTAPASQQCSNDYSDFESFDLLKPVRKMELENIRCVNTFTLTNVKTHFDLNFQNLTGGLAPEDSLTIDLGGASNELLINKATESLFNDRVVSSLGKQMAIVYHSVEEPKNSFNLSIQSRGAGGVIQVSENSPVTLNLAEAQNLVRFTIKPSSSFNYSVIKFPTNARITDTNLTISTGKETIAFFEDSYLPPSVTSNNPGETLIVTLAGKSFKQLEGTQVLSVNSSCNKLSFETGSYSILGNNSTCLWTVTSKTGLGLNVNLNNLTSNGCLSIKSLDSDSSNNLIYNKCNLTLSDILPTFTFKRAVVNVTLSGAGKLEAVLVHKPDPAIIQSSLSPPFNLTSYGYPLDYAVSSVDKSYNFKTQNKAYVVSVVDLDLRENEKLTINGTDTKEIVSGIDMMIPKNTTSNITVSNGPKAASTSLDSSYRRGFKLAISAYDSFIKSSEKKSANVSIPANMTSVYLTLTAEPGQKFNFTMDKIENVDVEIFDAKSIYGQRVKINGSSTSNNMIFTFNSKKDHTIPHLFVNYTVIPCNETSEHLCDNKTRCIPYVNLCKGLQFCDDGSDILTACNSSATIIKTTETGMSSFSVFLLSVVMIVIGACGAMYGPNLYKMVHDRVRGGQYSSFISSE